jgi:plastocyanin
LVSRSEVFHCGKRKAHKVACPPGCRDVKTPAYEANMKKGILSLAAVVLLGCGSTPPPNEDPSPETSAEESVDTDAAGPTITLGTMTFSPAALTIARGATVRFRNPTALPHTVTSGAGSTDPAAGKLFDKQVNPGQTVSIRFSKAGTVPYFCRFHESHGMKGSIVVH